MFFFVIFALLVSVSGQSILSDNLGLFLDETDAITKVIVDYYDDSIVYLAGKSKYDFLSPDFDPNSPVAGYANGWVMKMNTSSHVFWKKRIERSWDDEVSGLAVDQVSGDVFVSLESTDASENWINTFIVRLGKLDGSTVWDVRLNSDGLSVFMTSDMFVIEESLCGAFTIDGSGDLAGQSITTAMTDFAFIKVSIQYGSIESLQVHSSDGPDGYYSADYDPIHGIFVAVGSIGGDMDDYVNKGSGDMILSQYYARTGELIIYYTLGGLEFDSFDKVAIDQAGRTVFVLGKSDSDKLNGNDQLAFPGNVDVLFTFSMENGDLLSATVIGDGTAAVNSWALHPFYNTIYFTLEDTTLKAVDWKTGQQVSSVPCCSEDPLIACTPAARFDAHGNLLLAFKVSETVQKLGVSRHNLPSNQLGLVPIVDNEYFVVIHVSANNPKSPDSVYIVGQTTSNFFGSSDSEPFQSVLVVKMNINGTVEWRSRIIGMGSVQFSYYSSIVFDASTGDIFCNVYVSGGEYFRDGLDIAVDPVEASMNVLRLSAHNGRIVWARFIPTTDGAVMFAWSNMFMLEGMYPACVYNVRGVGDNSLLFDLPLEDAILYLAVVSFDPQTGLKHSAQLIPFLGEVWAAYAYYLQNANSLFVAGLTGAEVGGKTPQGMYDMMLLHIDTVTGTIVKSYLVGGAGEEYFVGINYSPKYDVLYLAGYGGSASIDVDVVEYGQWETILFAFDRQTFQLLWAKKNGDHDFEMNIHPQSNNVLMRSYYFSWLVAAYDNTGKMVYYENVCDYSSECLFYTLSPYTLELIGFQLSKDKKSVEYRLSNYTVDEVPFNDTDTYEPPNPPNPEDDTETDTLPPNTVTTTSTNGKTTTTAAASSVTTLKPTSSLSTFVVPITSPSTFTSTPSSTPSVSSSSTSSSSSSSTTDSTDLKPSGDGGNKGANKDGEASSNTTVIVAAVSVSGVALIGGMIVLGIWAARRRALIRYRDKELAGSEQATTAIGMSTIMLNNLNFNNSTQRADTTSQLPDTSLTMSVFDQTIHRIKSPYLLAGGDAGIFEVKQFQSGSYYSTSIAQTAIPMLRNRSRTQFLCVKRLIRGDNPYYKLIMDHEVNIMCQLAGRNNFVNFVCYSENPMFYVTDFYNIGTLDWALLRNRTVTTTKRTMVSFYHQIASAIAQLHAMGLVHMDVRPENIHLDQSAKTGEFILRLGDFSSVQYLDQRQSFIPLGHKSFSIAYAAPEMIELLNQNRLNDGNDRHLFPGADIFSLSIVFYEVMTGDLVYSSS